MPPLRELAPQPMVWDSRTATDPPPRARERAAERPVKPAPMMATSTRCGNSRGAGAGLSTVSSQKVFSRIEDSVRICRATVAETAAENPQARKLGLMRIAVPLGLWPLLLHSPNTSVLG